MAGSMSTTEKIGMWLAKADSTDSQAEKKLFMEKAQQVAARNSIDLAEARAAVAKGMKREEPTHKRVVCGTRGQRGLAYYIDLMLSIASINDLQTTIQGNVAVNLFGMPSDIEVAEAIYATAVTAMVQGGDEYLKLGEYKKDVQPRDVKIRKENPYAHYRGEPKYVYEWIVVHKPVSGMTARQNFYEGFVREVTRKLREAKREVVEEAKAHAAEIEQVAPDSSSTALVLFAKRDEVKGYRDSYYKGTKLGTYRGSKTPVHSGMARAAGRTHAQSTNLGGHATGIGGGRTQIGS